MMRRARDRPILHAETLTAIATVVSGVWRVLRRFYSEGTGTGAWILTMKRRATAIPRRTPKGGRGIFEMEEIKGLEP